MTWTSLALLLARSPQPHTDPAALSRGHPFRPAPLPCLCRKPQPHPAPSLLQARKGSIQDDPLPPHSACLATGAPGRRGSRRARGGGEPPGRTPMRDQEASQWLRSRLRPPEGEASVNTGIPHGRWGQDLRSQSRPWLPHSLLPSLTTTLWPVTPVLGHIICISHHLQPGVPKLSDLPLEYSQTQSQEAVDQWRRDLQEEVEWGGVGRRPTGAAPAPPTCALGPLLLTCRRAWIKFRKPGLPDRTPRGS